MRLMHAEGFVEGSQRVSASLCSFLDKFSERTQGALGLWLGSEPIHAAAVCRIVNC